MFLTSTDQIPEIAERSHFTIFELPKNLPIPEIPGSIAIHPNDKNTITIEEIRNITGLVRTKQQTPRTIVIHQADRLTEQAENCFLKLLEEPISLVRFVFLTHSASRLLPTTRSRAHIFTIKNTEKLNSPLTADPKTITLAKKYISATPRELPALSKIIAKDRETALQILDTATELLFKSYFLSANPKFLSKLSALTKTRDNIAHNGHIRLHLVTGMINMSN